MKFSSNLQQLRKKHNLSQEQLAEKLDVTRQSISKWESDQALPDIDKLLRIAKIFHCSLDTLMDGDIEETELKRKIPNFILKGKLLIEKILYMFMYKNIKEKIRFLIEVLLILAIVLLTKYPFEWLEGYLGNLLYQIPLISDVVMPILHAVIEMGYLIFAIYLFCYIFKIVYFEKIFTEESPMVLLSSERIVKEEKRHDNVEEVVKQEKPREKKRISIFNTILDIITGIFYYFFKFILIFALVFFVLCFLGAVIIYLWIFLLAFEGVLFFGMLIGFLGMFVLLVLFIRKSWFILSNSNATLKHGFTIFIGAIIVFGIGTAISVLEISSYTIVDEVSPLFTKKVLQEKVPMQNDLRYYSLHMPSYESVSFVEDETLGNELLLEVSYYEEYIKPKIYLSDNNLLYVVGYHQDFNIFSRNAYRSFVEGLKEHKVYSYMSSASSTVVIKGSKENLDMLRSNSKQYEEELKRHELEERIDELMTEIHRLQYENSMMEHNYLEEKEKLEIEIGVLKSEKEQLYYELIELKKQLQELLKY